MSNLEKEVERLILEKNLLQKKIFEIKGNHPPSYYVEKMIASKELSAKRAKEKKNNS